MTDEQMPEFAPFWHNVAKRRLGFPRCEACGRFHWYPLTRCPHCFAADIEWCAVEPRGTLYSWTVASTDALWILMPVRAVFVGGSGADGLHFIPTTPDERGSQDDGDPCVSSVQ